MMRRAVDAVTVAGEKGGTRAAVLAISVLTSMDATTLSQIGVTATPSESVNRLVKLAEASGVDGVVASPHEIESIRQAVSNPKFLVVTPGNHRSARSSRRRARHRRGNGDLTNERNCSIKVACKFWSRTLYLPQLRFETIMPR
jgi:orotidine-5'-phosphate decarboxylase